MFSKSLFKRSHLAFLCSGFVFINASSHAQTNTNKNSAADYQYSITANRFSPEYDAGVFILDKTDISESGASNIADVIRLVSGARFRESLDGSSNVKIDLSGFGATSSQNTMIMLDGVALNYSTLASIPLDIVESIEIMRHGTAVLYGANTTGGVINVITKPNANKNSRFIKWTLGAYGENKRDYALSQTSDDQKASFRISGSGRDTDGYRKNSASAEEGHQFDLTVKATNQTSLRILQSYERLNARLAGAISLNQFNVDPTQSKNLIDHSNTVRDRSLVNLEHKETNWMFIIDASRDNEDYQSIYSWGNYDGSANSTQINSRFNINYALGSINTSTTIGLDRKLQDSTTSFGSAITQDLTGYFLNQSLKLSPQIEAELGYRKDVLDQNSSSLLSPNQNTVEALSGSFTFKANQSQSYWLSLAKSYRLPTADENSFTQNNQLLNSQKSIDLALGHQTQFNAHSVSITIFHKRLSNELAYLSLNNGFGYNINLPDTRRLGFDISADWYINEQWSLDTRYSWLKAKFANGSMMNGIDLSGQSVPEVSKNVIHLGTKFKPTQETHFNLYGNYQSSQYLTNDWQNRGEKKPSLWIWNVSAQHTYNQKQMEWTFEGGIKNLTNRPYYAAGSVNVNTLAVSVYPAKPREVYLGASLRF